MSLAIVVSRAQFGVAAPRVDVEVQLSGGLPGTSIVGLAAAAVKESRDRVRAAIVNAQFDYPQRRITINLAPADLPKEGCRFDLPIALGILAASHQIPMASLEGVETLGELALSGGLRRIGGVLPAALHARAAGHTLIVPAANAAEAALVDGVDLRVADSLIAVCAHLRGEVPLPRPTRATFSTSACGGAADLADVRGQAMARRALEIAAAGAHNLLLRGPPGAGKTMLAVRLAGILPALTEDEALEAAAVRSVAGFELDAASYRQRVTRAPHHTASAIAMIGGGPRPRPGEISLAHHGVLFLDELPEFQRGALEALREPMESGRVLVSRAARQAEFPARFQLIAAMNPCPCGYAGEPGDRCRCTPEIVQRYASRVSGPLLDRIDLHLDVPRLPHAALASAAPSGESSATVRERVVAARAVMVERNGHANARLTTPEMTAHCALTSSDARLLEVAVDRLGLSARASHRVLRVARTIADLAGGDRIETAHLTEALSFRRVDRRA
jgi:magnesium chelatase family protein